MFRSKLSKEQFSSEVLGAYVHYGEQSYNKLARALLDVHGEEKLAFLVEQERFELFISLWIFSAGIMSVMRHRNEASEISNLAVKSWEYSDEVHKAHRDIATRIVRSIKDDEFIFHNLSFMLYINVYPEIAEYISPFGNSVNETYVVSGIDLAACLRAIDSFLRSYKLAR
jgi:hypothetical protein